MPTIKLTKNIKIGKKQHEMIRKWENKYLESMAWETSITSVQNCTSDTFFFPIMIPLWRWKCTSTMSSFSAGWKKACLMFLYITSTILQSRDPPRSSFLIFLTLFLNFRRNNYSNFRERQNKSVRTYVLSLVRVESETVGVGLQRTCSSSFWRIRSHKKISQTRYSLYNDVSLTHVTYHLSFWQSCD